MQFKPLLFKGQLYLCFRSGQPVVLMMKFYLAESHPSVFVRIFLLQSLTQISPPLGFSFILVIRLFLFHLEI